MRNTIFRYFRFLLIILLGLLSGCLLTQQDSAGDGSKPAELLYSGVYGTRTMHGPSALWITNRLDLEQVYSNLNKRHLKDAVAPPDIDFDVYGVLFLEMGQKPTGGYAIDFSPSLSRVIHKQAVINIFWKVPDEGVLLTQTVTSPFMLLKVQRVGRTSIRVIDQVEHPLFEISIK